METVVQLMVLIKKWKKNLVTPHPVFRVTGHRKRAIAQAVMVQGTGKIRVNTVPIEQFIVDKILLQDLLQGLTCTKTSTMFDVWFCWAG